MPDATNENRTTTDGDGDQPVSNSGIVDAVSENALSGNTLSRNTVAGNGESERGQGEETLLARCERLIGYEFSDKSLLVSALTHASGAENRLSSNERLEFLGDSILGFVVCEALFRQF